MVYKIHIIPLHYYLLGYIEKNIWCKKYQYFFYTINYLTLKLYWLLYILYLKKRLIISFLFWIIQKQCDLNKIKNWKKLKKIAIKNCLWSNNNTKYSMKYLVASIENVYLYWFIVIVTTTTYIIFLHFSLIHEWWLKTIHFWIIHQTNLRFFLANVAICQESQIMW